MSMRASIWAAWSKQQRSYRASARGIGGPTTLYTSKTVLFSNFKWINTEPLDLTVAVLQIRGVGCLRPYSAENKARSTTARTVSIGPTRGPPFLSGQWNNRVTPAQKRFFKTKGAEEAKLHRETYPWYKLLRNADKEGAETEGLLADADMVTQTIWGFLYSQSTLRWRRS
ncbi:hypothetical protein F5Y04DRAFT_281681 [Hypomontagnella monticulosa]|nr:hypothetical protein F5Y04DRAFT_281681 [Hypomontagnella monticulosa]